MTQVGVAHGELSLHDESTSSIGFDALMMMDSYALWCLIYVSHAPRGGFSTCFMMDVLLDFECFLSCLKMLIMDGFSWIDALYTCLLIWKYHTWLFSHMDFLRG